MVTKQTSSIAAAKEASAAEISKLLAGFENQRRNVSEELAALYKARASGQTVDVIPPPADVESRKLAAQLMNGNAPPDFLQNFPERTREAQLTLERSALGLCIETLQNNYRKATAIEAAAWRVANIAHWKNLWRSALLTRARLKSLQKQIVAMGKEAKFAELPLAGWSAMLLEENPMIAFDRCINEAIAAGIIDARELKKQEALDAKD
jgi:hypothetical protein